MLTGPQDSPNSDITVPVGNSGFHFNYRVAALIRRGDTILLARAADETHWHLPGGRVQAGELAPQALGRELVQEINAPLRSSRLAITAESIFALPNKRIHEVGLYFEVEVALDAEFANVASNKEFVGTEPHLRLAWTPRSRLASVDLRPVDVRDALARSREIRVPLYIGVSELGQAAGTPALGPTHNSPSHTASLPER